MNWKFWQWRGQVSALLVSIKVLNEQLAARDQAVQNLQADNERIYRVLQFKHRPPADQPTEAQIASALAVVNETTPLWRAVHRLLDLIEEDQKTAVCLGNLTDAQRHYNAGRLAMCEDLRDALLQKWVEAQRENHAAQRS